MDAKKIEEVPFEEVYEVEKYGTYYSENKPLQTELLLSFLHP